MASKPHHEARALELMKTVDRVDHSTTVPDKSIVMHYKTWIFKEIPMKHEYWKKSIIDLGCDVGHTFSSVNRSNIVSVDLVDRPEVPNFVKADLEERLPFKDNAFDIVVLTEVLEHIEDPQFTLSEAIRIAKEKVIVSVPYEFKWTDDMEPFTHGEHIRYFTYDSFRELIESTGFNNSGIIETYLGNEESRVVWLGSVITK